MSSLPLQPPSTRLGQLQRGRGAGWLAAVAAGRAAVDDVVHCVLFDPRVDAQFEVRERYYASLWLRLEVGCERLVGPLANAEPGRLGHGVLAGLWRLGHAEVRDLLAAEVLAPLGVAVVRELHDRSWAVPAELSRAAAREWLRYDAEWQDSTLAARRIASGTALSHLSVEQLLDEARRSGSERRDRVLGELCARGDEPTRAALAKVVEEDVVYDRVRVAARALGTMGDERVLDFAEMLFAREDVFGDPKRSLHGFERMRRYCLTDYVLCLPHQRALVLARNYLPRGGYFETVAGKVFAEYATAADRAMLEARVRDGRRAGDDWGTLFELEALARIGDPRSGPLLLEVAHEADYAPARTRAINALSAMPELPGVAEVLREALWDCEDEAAATACSFAPRNDEVRQRIAELATDPLADDALRQRASRAMRSSG
ncbi:MAG: hypothetical protein RL398_201 [Planctomycetota bacterium]|jgi:hypothetical protein